MMVGTVNAKAQNEREYARMGNKALEAGNYEEALQYFDEALKEKPDWAEVKYNRALAQYKSEEYEEAAEKFNEVTLSASDKKLKSKAFHNMGNSLLKQEKWQESAEAFKKALMNNPADEDSRYNLSYALQKIQQQQEEQENEENEDEENKDEESEDEDSSDQDENEDGNEDDDGSDQDEDEEDGEDENSGEAQNEDGEDEEDDEGGSDQNDEGDEEEEQQQPQPNQLSQEDVDRILDALLNEERQVQEGLNKEKGQPVKGKQIEKEW